MSGLLAECLALEAECPIADAVEMLSSPYMETLRRTVRETMPWLAVSGLPTPVFEWIMGEEQNCVPAEPQPMRGGVQQTLPPEFLPSYYHTTENQ